MSENSRSSNDTERRCSAVAMAEMMSAVIPTRPGGPEVLRLVERLTPQPSKGEVLIKVGYAGVNPHDVGQRKLGVPPVGATDVLGLEVSGEIVSIGEGVAAERLGEHVAALVDGGGYASYCLSEGELAFPTPAGVDDRDAAALPEGLFTAWLNLVDLGGLASGATALIHGGTGGVGSIAIQMAKALGCKVVATASSADKCGYVASCGADIAVNRSGGFRRRMQRGDCRPRGACYPGCCGGTLRGTQPRRSGDGWLYCSHIGWRQPDLRRAFGRHHGQEGSRHGLPAATFVARPQTVDPASIKATLWPRVGDEIRPLIDSIYPIADVVEAHRRLDAKLNVGKILLDFTSF